MPPEKNRRSGNTPRGVWIHFSLTARETVAKPLSEREKKRREAKLRKELETPYRKWLNEDVAYIITDEERAAFKRLQTDEEREQFIEQFWLRRDPTHPRRIQVSSGPDGGDGSAG